MHRIYNSDREIIAALLYSYEDSEMDSEDTSLYKRLETRFDLPEGSDIVMSTSYPITKIDLGQYPDDQRDVGKQMEYQKHFRKDCPFTVFSVVYEVDEVFDMLRWAHVPHWRDSQPFAIERIFRPYALQKSQPKINGSIRVEMTCNNAESDLALRESSGEYTTAITASSDFNVIRRNVPFGVAMLSYYLNNKLSTLKRFLRLWVYAYEKIERLVQIFKSEDFKDNAQLHKMYVAARDIIDKLEHPYFTPAMVYNNQVESPLLSKLTYSYSRSDIPVDINLNGTKIIQWLKWDVFLNSNSAFENGKLNEDMIFLQDILNGHVGSVIEASKKKNVMISNSRMLSFQSLTERDEPLPYILNAVHILSRFFINTMSSATRWHDHVIERANPSCDYTTLYEIDILTAGGMKFKQQDVDDLLALTKLFEPL